jgi:hypothetical protein
MVFVQTNDLGAGDSSRQYRGGKAKCIREGYGAQEYVVLIALQTVTHVGRVPDEAMVGEDGSSWLTVAAQGVDDGSGRVGVWAGQFYLCFGLEKS